MPPVFDSEEFVLKNNGMRRLTWGGLLRALNRRNGVCFEHEHITVRFQDGHREYLNIKYDAMKHPYFVLVRERRQFR